MLYFIVFTLGSAFGVMLMCLFQINRMGANIKQPLPGDSPQREGGADEQ